MIYLSHILDVTTPTYGNRNEFLIGKQSDIKKGDVANDSYIKTTVHIGTHIDMPYHFYESGQTIEDFDASFWVFTNPLIIEINQEDLIIKENLINRLLKIKNDFYDILIVKTGIEKYRDQEKFWAENYGFHPDVYKVLIEKLPSIRVLGFDSISVSSLKNRKLGRESHKAFLNPERPVLLLEDMRLEEIDEDTIFKQIIVSPMLIKNCDGLPCTILGII